MKCEDCVHYFFHKKNEKTIYYACLRMVFGDEGPMHPDWFQPRIHKNGPDTDCPKWRLDLTIQERH